MKKLTLFTILLIASSIGWSQTNQYHKFVTEGAWWDELFISYPFEWDSIPYIQHESIWGDTIIDGKSYYLMASFMMREDTINKKVYGREYGLDWPDTLMYDFNLNVGESAAGCAEFSVGNLFPDATVINIDSVLIGTYRKRWEIKYTPLVENGDSITFWIEGIGSDNGIWEPYGSWYWPVARRLICYSENDSLLYSDLQYWYDCDEIFEDTTDNILEYTNESSFTVWPNPADKYTEIVFPADDIFRTKQIAIFNCSNQTVLKDTFYNTRYNLDCSNFYAGLYFILVSDGERVYYNKFIVTH